MGNTHLAPILTFINWQICECFMGADQMWRCYVGTQKHKIGLRADNASLTLTKPKNLSQVQVATIQVMSTQPVAAI